MSTVRLVHLSDTHCMHWSIETHFPIPEADILIHTGDFTNNGSDAQLSDFIRWLQAVSGRFKDILLIAGNHDWWATYEAILHGTVSAADAVAPGFMHRKFEALGMPKNCRLLDHEEVVVQGLRFWGSPWCPWHPGASSEHVNKKDVEIGCFEAWQRLSGSNVRHRFDEIPEGVDVLLTHGPALHIMDCIGSKGFGWGSSRALLDAIQRTKPCMHLFGHLHEQRGLWKQTPDGFEGGIEYRARPGDAPFVTTGPPPVDYPCKIVSNNAMANHPGIERAEESIAAGARLILAEVRPQLGRPADLALPRDVQMRCVDEGKRVGEFLIENPTRQRCLTSSADVAITAPLEKLAFAKWSVIECPHEPDAVYFVESATGKFLDTHGYDVQVWNSGGRSVAEIIAGNTSRFARNIRWSIAECPHQAGACYIINKGFETFLDASSLNGVQMWNNGGKSVEDVIAGNTSRHAGNLRWVLQPI